jgi:hypothetical protein
LRKRKRVTRRGLGIELQEVNILFVKRIQKRVVKAEVESKAEPMTDDHGADGGTAAELEPIGDNY